MFSAVLLPIGSFYFACFVLPALLKVENEDGVIPRDWDEYMDILLFRQFLTSVCFTHLLTATPRSVKCCLYSSPRCSCSFTQESKLT